MKRFIRFILLLVAATLLILSPHAEAGLVYVPGSSSGNFAVKVQSIKERRFKTTVRQQYDFSCGSAALATLLTYHYEDPHGEPEIFKAMYDAGDQEKIKKDGFSLLDIKNYLTTKGYLSDGYKVSLDKLEEIGIPAIVLINLNGYRHFVVVKGVTDSEVLLGDPSHGSRRMSREKFEPMWNGLLFVIRSKQDVANRNFNREQGWQVHAKAPIGLALRNSELANVTWLLPGPYEF